MDITLSEEFDSIYNRFQRILDGEWVFDTKNGGKSAGVERLQADLEALTTKVSRMDMFSRDEAYEEMDPQTLKFLLIPYFLGVTWQLKEGIERKHIWVNAEVYFRDFLERLLDAGILLRRPRILTLIQAEGEVSGGDDSETSTPSVSHPTPSASLPTGDDSRRLKIARFKQGQELEEKIRILRERSNNNGGAGGDDDEEVQQLHLHLLRRHALNAEAELECIFSEKELVASHHKSSAAETNLESQPTGTGQGRSQLPYETFIIAKTEIQKKTFGLGYPSIPVMTVEELYQDRVEKGIWTNPTDTTPTPHGPSGDDGEGVQAEQEATEAADDQQLRAQQRAVDEYKDAHRRGWGNRMNRS